MYTNCNNMYNNCNNNCNYTNIVQSWAKAFVTISDIMLKRSGSPDLLSSYLRTYYQIDNLGPGFNPTSLEIPSDNDLMIQVL